MYAVSSFADPRQWEFHLSSRHQMIIFIYLKLVNYMEYH